MARYLTMRDVGCLELATLLAAIPRREPPHKRDRCQTSGTDRRPIAMASLVARQYFG